MKGLLACFKTLTCLLIIFLLLSSCGGRSGKPRVLVFAKTAGFHHASITDGIAAIQKLGGQNGFDVDTTTDAEKFTDDTLRNYSAVVFLSTTGDVLNNFQEAAFERFIQAGGGFMGIHAATDTEYDWGWYGRLVGAYFLDHPGINDTFPNVQEGVLQVVDSTNAATKHLPHDWKRTDEFYSFKKISPDIKVILRIDEKSYHGGKNGDNHPMAWYHEFDGGRAFYTELGHTKESYTEEPYLQHILAGIQYAIGDNKKLDYSKARTLDVPVEDRFTKTMLITGQFFEPTEMTILPNLDVLVVQRRGEIMLCKKGDNKVRQVGYLPVYWKTNTPGVNAEEGILGLKADPNFEKNHYVYIFYSPLDTSVNRLSRFTFENNSIDMKSEKIVLQFYSQREICCHTGGSIAFDKDGLLYLSTGDNSTPFDEPGQKFVNHGYAPLDGRPGHAQYDARRTAGNANDLRGKILRIRVKADGSYEIPDGNLYPKGQAGTRPEIYVQGNRNPYRISVDQKNSYLYWGEVGPDASNDSLATRGPRGYDEVNQARKAGYFGWPLFIGNNYPYHAYDYSNGQVGPNFDPSKPLNNSINNTGIQDLPAAQPAFIWYPYAASPDFPQVKTGGRNAMAGPVYYTDMFPKETRLPDYYDKKLFIYDWIRGWIKAVTLQPNGDFDKMEPFMEHTKFNAVIDMEVGPDGKLYLLEYGSGWFSKNEDAGLSRIDFEGGNLPPKIASISVDKTAGVLPFKVTATVNATDPEKKSLTYVWDMGNGTKKETKEPSIEYTYDKAGEYIIWVAVTDAEKGTAKSGPATVYAGNDIPEVTVKFIGNQTFYLPGQPVQYEVTVRDPNDPSASSDSSGLFISADYVEGTDKAGASQGHLVMSEAMTGKSLVQSLDCKGCHKQAEKSIGPAYEAVSQRYMGKADASAYLMGKIKKGGGGVWGEVAMPAHPDLKDNDAHAIVTWIQSLSAKEATAKTLPSKGKLKPTLDKPLKDNGELVISASYTDKGGTGIKPLTGTSIAVLKNPKMFFRGVRKMKEFTSFDYNSILMMLTPKGTGWFVLDSIDLTGITKAELMLGWQTPPTIGYKFELRLDSPDGQKLGEATVKTNAKSVGFPLAINLSPVTDGKFHDLYVVSTSIGDESKLVAVQSILFSVK